MKKLWKILLSIGAVIGGIFVLTAGKGNKKEFKKDLKDNKKKIKDVKGKTKKAKQEKKKIKEKKIKQDKKITISDFDKKYRSKK